MGKTSIQALERWFSKGRKVLGLCLGVSLLLGVIFLITVVVSVNWSRLRAVSVFQVSPIFKGVRSGGRETEGKIAAGTSLDLQMQSGVVMRFHYCPPGNFVMGSPLDEPGRDITENQVSVTISQGFWMAETEVTQDQWSGVMGENDTRFRGGRLPVERVSWFDAQEMVRKLNLTVKPVPGFVFALPTEAQWEYACRAGAETAFAFGHGLTTRDANYRSLEPRPVRKFRSNAWGLYDMHGNVWEWCADWYGGQLHAGVDPKGVPSGILRVIRGGGWNSCTINCRSAERGGDAPKLRVGCVGLRLALVKSE
jgi:sulfatase modifying factor 1